MSGLPKGWAEATIGEIAEYVSRGRSPKYVEHSEFPVINQRCVRWHGVDEAHVKFIDPTTWHQWDEQRYLRRNDILWNSTGTGTIGRAALFSELRSYDQAVVDSHVTIVRAGPAIEPAYLFGFIHSPAVQDKIEDMQSGSTNQVELNRSEIVATMVPVAPIPEQRRIVAKVDELTARTARARKELNRIPTLIARYKQRLLALAFSEFAAKTAVDHLPFSDVVSSAQNGISKRRGDTGRMINVLRLADLTDGHFVGDDPREIMLTAVEEGKYGLETDDLICIRVNGSEKLVGRMLVWEGQPNWAFCDHFIRFKTNSMVCLSKYVSYFFASDKVRAQIESSFVSSAGQKTVSQGTLGRILVPVPPLEEQAEIVRRIESAFGWLDRMAADHAAAARLLPKLDAAILAKAFRGELVPQDPNDESATVLLERIKADRDTAPKKVPRRVRPRVTVDYEVQPVFDGRKEVDGPTDKDQIRDVIRKGKPMQKTRQDEDVMGKPYLAAILKAAPRSDVQALFRAANLPVADFYKQLASEIGKGYILDDPNELRAA